MCFDGLIVSLHLGPNCIHRKNWLLPLRQRFPAYQYNFDNLGRGACKDHLRGGGGGKNCLFGSLFGIKKQEKESTV